MNDTSKEITVVLKLTNISKEILTAAAMCAAYPAWDDEYSRKKIQSAWGDKEDTFRARLGYTITADEVFSLTDEERQRFGFTLWDEELPIILIPLWAWNYIEDGSVLTSIGGTVKVKGTDEIDLDVRFGCIAYGFLKAKTEAEEPNSSEEMGEPLQVIPE